MSLLEVKNLKVAYGGIQAVKGIDLHIDQGELVTLIGANGAGKTTTLRAVSNLLAGERGEVTKGSIDLRGERIELEARCLAMRRRGWLVISNIIN